MSGERGPAQERVRLDRRVSVDLCFWASGDGDAGELYEDAADGVDHTFAASERVLELRTECYAGGRIWPIKSSRWSSIRTSTRHRTFRGSSS